MANALSYVPSKSFDETERKVYGLATIQVGKDRQRAKVTFLKDNVDFLFNMDAFPRTPKLDAGTKDTYMVVLSGDKTEVEKVGPAEGIFHAKVVEISRPEEGADPAPYDVKRTIQQGDKKGQEYTFQEFKLFFEIQRGRFKTIRIPCWLRYLFQQDPNNPEYAGWKGDPQHKNAKHLPRLIDISEQVGAVDAPIEWPEDGNILPTYFDRILKADKMVMLVIKDGYISTVSHSEYEDEVPVAAAPVKDEFEESAEDEFEEPVKPVKKNGKNGKKDTKSDL